MLFHMCPAQQRFLPRCGNRGLYTPHQRNPRRCGKPWPLVSFPSYIFSLHRETLRASGSGRHLRNSTGTCSGAFAQCPSPALQGDAVEGELQSNQAPAGTAHLGPCFILHLQTPLCPVLAQQPGVPGPHPPPSETACQCFLLSEEGQATSSGTAAGNRSKKNRDRSGLHLPWELEHISSCARLLGTCWGQAAWLVWEPVAAS